MYDQSLYLHIRGNRPTMELHILPKQVGSLLFFYSEQEYNDENDYVSEKCGFRFCAFSVTLDVSVVVSSIVGLLVLCLVDTFQSVEILLVDELVVTLDFAGITMMPPELLAASLSSSTIVLFSILFEVDSFLRSHSMSSMCGNDDDEINRFI